MMRLESRHKRGIIHEGPTAFRKTALETAARPSFLQLSSPLSCDVLS
jgi:hypothetical protein